MKKKRICDCVQRAQLRQTGWGKPHPEWYCPVCKQEYYVVNSTGELTKERPFEWPKGKRENI